MLQYIHISVFLLCISLPSFSSSFQNSSTHVCHHDEKMALIRFKNTLTIDASFSDDCIDLQLSYPKTRSWKGNTDCCFWDGITCDFMTGHVIGLDLSCSQLGETINPNSTLFHLQHLQAINLASNSFSSSISPRFGNFRGLKLLNLSNSDFWGKVPNEISQLSQLVVLDLSFPLFIDQGFFHNSMHTSFLEYFTTMVLRIVYAEFVELEMPNFDIMMKNLTNLRVLHLDSVRIDSVLSQSLANLSSMTSLQLNFCKLRGEFPTNILKLPRLQTLEVNMNPGLFSSATQFFNMSGSLEVIDFTLTNLSDGCLIETITVEYMLEDVLKMQDLMNHTEVQEEEQQEEEENRRRTEIRGLSSSSSSVEESTVENQAEEEKDLESQKQILEEEKDQDPVVDQETMKSSIDEHELEPPLEGRLRSEPNLEKKDQEISKPVLPDCLLLMMCEPKLSMEVSKETWVCSTEFRRWLPERNQNNKKAVVNKTTGGGGSDESSKKKKTSTAEKRAPLPPQPPSQAAQPARSSISFPTGGE